MSEHRSLHSITEELRLLARELELHVAALSSMVKYQLGHVAGTDREIVARATYSFTVSSSDKDLLEILRVAYCSYFKRLSRTFDVKAITMVGSPMQDCAALVDVWMSYSYVYVSASVTIPNAIVRESGV